VCALEDHHFLIGRAEVLLSRYLKYQAHQLVPVLHQVGWHLVADNTTARVELSDSIGVD